MEGLGSCVGMSGQISNALIKDLDKISAFLANSRM